MAQTDVILWLASKLFAEFESGTLSVWLIGSFVTAWASASDCDVLILPDPQCMERLAQLSPTWREEFEQEFAIPLHLTRLTRSESKRVDKFLESVLNKPNIPITPDILHL